MAQNANTMTIWGNLVDDPEIRFTPNGVAVTSFRIASTPRVFDKNTNQWADGEATFMSCSAWRGLAENISNSLRKGDRVIVSGSLKQRSWEKDGEKRTSYELEIEEVGPSLKYSTATLQKAGRGSSAPGRPAQPRQDVWNSASQQESAPFAQGDEEPPF